MSDDQPAVSANRELATRIVAAFVRRHQIGADQIPTLISTVHQALAGLGKPVPEAAVPRTPCRSDQAICPARLRRLLGVRVARLNASPAYHSRPWVDGRGIPKAMELTFGAPTGRARL
jgi:hypothetical protein